MDGIEDFNKTVAGASQIQSIQGEKAADEFLRKNGIDSGDSKVRAVVNIAANDKSSLVRAIFGNLNKIAREKNDDEYHTYQDVMKSLEKNLNFVTEDKNIDFLSGVNDLNDLMSLYKASYVLDRQEKESTIAKLQAQRAGAVAAGEDTSSLDAKIAELEFSM